MSLTIRLVLVGEVRSDWEFYQQHKQQTQITLNSISGLTSLQISWDWTAFKLRSETSTSQRVGSEVTTPGRNRNSPWTNSSRRRSTLLANNLRGYNVTLNQYTTWRQSGHRLNKVSDLFDKTKRKLSVTKGNAPRRQVFRLVTDSLDQWTNHLHCGSLEYNINTK